MTKNNKRKLIYLAFILLTIVTSITGATYAYWTATTQSTENAVSTSSTIYKISMHISPLYIGHTLIPMNDEYALKGLKNECLDKYGRGACLAYKIRVYDYNLSYMMYRISDEFNEEKCVKINNQNYCIVKEVEHMKDGVGLSLGDKYDVTGIPETEFILLIWLTNLKTSQNDTDIGNFNAIITMQAGNGGEIKGSISSVIVPDNTDKGDADIE